MTLKELVDNKYPIDKNYSEQLKLTELSRLETRLEFYERSHSVTAAILTMHENEYIHQIQAEQLSIEDHRHILFVGKYQPKDFSVVTSSSFSTCTDAGNMYAKIMRRRISSTSTGFYYSKCGFLNSNASLTKKKKKK